LAVEAEQLVKTFGEVRAVSGLSLSVPAGTVYGLLGPNGAGKTTVVRILATLLKPEGGYARVLGHDVVKEATTVRGLVSLTGQFASVDEDLTGTENLVLIGRLLGYPTAKAKARATTLLEAFDLATAAGRQVKTYSGGMRRRLDIAASIVVRPEIIFLDEPTTGLDPRSRAQVWDIVRVLVAQGTTVLLTTQYLEEADQLASRIAVIEHGRVIAEGSPAELKSSVGSSTLRLRLQSSTQRGEAREFLIRHLGRSVELDGDPSSLSVRMKEPDIAATAIAELARSGVAVASFSLEQPSLDEVFLSLTGHPAEAPSEGEDGI